MQDMIETFSAELHKICYAIVAAGGRPVIVGGAVRDHIMGLRPKDYDIECFGLSIAQLQTALKEFKTDFVGQSFGVLKVFCEYDQYDVSLPRRERKTGSSHTDFDIETDSQMTFEEACLRRDFTMNAIGYDVISAKIIDPFDGVGDIRAKILRHVGPAFAEDPLRVFRAAQFVGRFDLSIADETLKICRSLAPELIHIPHERIFVEIMKAMKFDIAITLASLIDFDSQYFAPTLTKLFSTEKKFSDWGSQLAFIHPGDNSPALWISLEYLAVEDGLPFGKIMHELGERRTDVIKRVKNTVDVIRSQDWSNATWSDYAVATTKVNYRDLETGLAHTKRLYTPHHFDIPDFGPIPKVVQGRYLESKGMVQGPLMGKVIAQVYARQLAGSITEVELFDYADKLIAKESSSK